MTAPAPPRPHLCSYFAQNGTCVPCGGDGVSECDASGKATACNGGFYLKDGACIQCPASCSSCDDDKTCPSCEWPGRPCSSWAGSWHLQLPRLPHPERVLLPSAPLLLLRHQRLWALQEGRNGLCALQGRQLHVSGQGSTAGRGQAAARTTPCLACLHQ